MKGIMQDIKNGNLPAEEIPGFVAWGIGKLFWPLITLLFAAAIALVIVSL